MVCGFNKENTSVQNFWSHEELTSCKGECHVQFCMNLLEFKLSFLIYGLFKLSNQSHTEQLKS